MATPRQFFPYFESSQLEWTQEKPGFTELAETALGDAATDGDGFDPPFNAANQAVGELGKILASIQDCVANVIAAATNFDDIDTASVDAAVAETLKQIEATSAPVGAAIAGLTLPTASLTALGGPPPAPSISVAVSTSGEGGSGPGLPAPGASGPAGTLAGIGLGATAAGIESTSGFVAGALGFLSNPVTAIVGVVALVSILAEFIGKGCGQPCIESAKLEQVYEVAADIVGHAVSIGMLPFTQWVNIYGAILQQGQQAFTQLKSQGDPKAQSGLTNMQQVLAGLHPVAPAKTQKYDWNTLVTSWLATTNTSGWYPDSLSSGENMAQNLLGQVFTNQG